MKNPRQLKMIKEILTNEHGKQLQELAKVQAMIAKKTRAIEHINNYRKEYNNPSYLPLSRETPVLSQNIERFISQIMVMIDKDKNELFKLNTIKKTLTSKIETLQSKLDYITSCELGFLKEEAALRDKNLQHLIDDLAANQMIRISHD